jgi:hypothetical protein
MKRREDESTDDFDARMIGYALAAFVFFVAIAAMGDLFL